MKIRTQDDLFNLIDDERNWRVSEIRTLQRNSLSANFTLPHKEVQRRALIPIAYAHWEGFVKNAGRRYLEYVAGQKLRLVELAACFQSVYFCVKLDNELRKDKMYGVLELLRQLESDAGNRVHLNAGKVVLTKGNLNSDALAEVCKNLGASG